MIKGSNKNAIPIISEWHFNVELIPQKLHIPTVLPAYLKQGMGDLA